MNLADQLAPVLALAAEKGVDLGIPAWFKFDAESKWWCDSDPRNWLSPDAAALIITGSISAWLAGQGIAVWLDESVWCWSERDADGGIITIPTGATDHLSALLAAVLARLAELPNKENA